MNARDRPLTPHKQPATARWNACSPLPPPQRRLPQLPSVGLCTPQRWNCSRLRRRRRRHSVLWAISILVRGLPLVFGAESRGCCALGPPNCTPHASLRFFCVKTQPHHSYHSSDSHCFSTSQLPALLRLHHDGVRRGGIHVLRFTCCKNCAGK